MTIYVASALGNYTEVIRLQNQLRDRGWSFPFDWAECYRKQTEEALHIDGVQLALDMYAGVLNAENLILYCPGKRGAHVEFGIAYQAGSRVWILNPNPADDIKFYTLPNIVLLRTEEELLSNFQQRI